MNPAQASEALKEAIVHLKAINSLLGNLVAGPVSATAYRARKLQAKYHDDKGNLAEIERNANGTLFVRLVRMGISRGQIVRAQHGTNVVYGIRDEGREPDIAYACFEGTEQEVIQYLHERGFPLGDVNGA